MKKNNKIIIRTVVIILILIVFVLLSFYGVLKNKKDGNINNELIDKDSQSYYHDMLENSVMYDDTANVESLKNEYRMTGETDLYNIETEYDGRKVLTIKSNINYKVAFCGMIKKSKPSFKEIDSLFSKNSPQKTGIWIEECSREKILDFLNNNEKIFSNYIIDELG